MVRSRGKADELESGMCGESTHLAPRQATFVPWSWNKPNIPLLLHLDTHSISSLYLPNLQGSCEGARLNYLTPCIENLRRPRRFCWHARLAAHLHHVSQRLPGTCMYSASQAIIKDQGDTLLEASEMPLAVNAACDYIPDIATPPTPEMRGPPRTSIAWQLVSLASPGLCGMKFLVAVAHEPDTSV
jgi:hypothetical protein